MPGLKIKTARPGWLFLLAGGLACGWAGGAQAADPRVLVLEPDGASPRLLAALQIQLVGLATVETVPRPSAASTAEQIDAAAAIARERKALAALWTERPTARADGSRQVVLYVVGEREGRALIEVVRVPGDRGPELDRTLALKVREILAELRRSQSAAPPESLLLSPPQPSAASPSTATASNSEAASPRLSGLGQVGLRLGSQPRVGLGRWGLGVALGPTLSYDALRFAAAVGVDWFPFTTVEFDAQRARYWEVAGTFALQVQLRAGAFWLGVQTGPQLLWLYAIGTTDQRTEGERTANLWAWNAGLVAELPISAGLALATELQLQTPLRPHGFSVNGRELIDLGSARMRLGVAMTFRP